MPVKSDLQSAKSKKKKKHRENFFSASVFLENFFPRRFSRKWKRSSASGREVQPEFPCNDAAGAAGGGLRPET